jgi:phosphatidylinositol alpha 1,6-mannosyltransferase
MRIAIITESFPPDVNGVAHSVLRVTEQLLLRCHQVLIIAPEPSRPVTELPSLGTPVPCRVVRVPSMSLPGYPSFRIGLPSRRVRHELNKFRPDVVHLASPVILGAYAGTVARSLNLPVVAVYQTDLPAYAREYRLSVATQAFAWRWLRGIHNGAARTLAPSTVTAADLIEHGIERVWLWGRGVDTSRFSPTRRSSVLRSTLASDGSILVGYVGRLAIEKRVDLLAPVASLPGVRLVVVGGGPAFDELRAAMPSAIFLGERHGTELAEIYASLDVFVHSGPHETFGQTLQEAAASGLPVVAPAAGGPLDLVDDGSTGFLVPPGDADALATAVAKLAADPALRARLGAASRSRVLGRSWGALTEQLLDHYEAALGAREVAAA